MNILITGGAGYIGSHVVKQLGKSTNHRLYVIDNLSTGNEKAVLYGTFIRCDLSDIEKLRSIFASYKIDAVLHFAASIDVAKSLKNPLLYYYNNTVNTLNLIQLSIEYNVKKFIFSSTAAVYGDNKYTKVKESDATLPLNPYGFSKLAAERILADSAKNNKNFHYVILRYFNVAGASIDNTIGQFGKNASHLIGIAAQAALNKTEQISIYGNDYDTPDGTCIRDYIHVEDIASAHLAALMYDKSGTFNCGYGKGYSVKQVVETMQKVSKNRFPVKIAKRREGDIGAIIADNSLILEKLKWQPKYDDLEFICRSTLQWEKLKYS